MSPVLLRESVTDTGIRLRAADQIVVFEEFRNPTRLHAKTFKFNHLNG